MQTVTTIGLDIAKSFFQVHGLAACQAIIRHQLKGRYVSFTRSEFSHIGAKSNSHAGTSYSCGGTMAQSILIGVRGTSVLRGKKSACWNSAPGKRRSRSLRPSSVMFRSGNITAPRLANSF